MLLSILGASMLATSAIGAYMNLPTTQIRKRTHRYFQDGPCKKATSVEVGTIARTEYGYTMRLVMPYGMTFDKLETHRAGLEHVLEGTVRLRLVYGRICEAQIGYAEFHQKMNYTDALPAERLAIPLHTPYGLKLLDFSDETTCHLLQGGATRMGKSVFLRYAVTHLMKATEGNIRFILIDNKITDLYMFRNIPQIEIAETVGEARMLVSDVIEEIEERKARLKAKGDVVDAQDFREKYPDEPMEPLFVVIDEYGRFAEDEEFQEQIILIAETAGYVDVHLVISAQRPDSSNVLKPRIKANILTRLSFTTADEANSNIILGIPDAAHLGRIQGRAILMDGFPEVVQVPYLSSAQATAILKPFYRSVENDETRPSDTETIEALPSFVSGSTREFGLS